MAEIIAHSETASRLWAQTDPGQRASGLEAMADALDAKVDQLVPIAQQETHLAEARLRSELQRTTFQLRLFAETLRDGSYLEVRIDHADPQWPMGAPRPDLRRSQVPLGPVVVFAASNFPFAFSVAGGDTASALAAGCSVILKAHSGHPRLSLAVAEIVSAALEQAGAPLGVFHVIFGLESGKAALSDPRIKAGSFTGSIQGGRALFDLAQSRPEPIPFYGELGSVNPVFVSASAAAQRPEQIAQEFITSMTLGAGQFCTKPGILFVPDESQILEALKAASWPAPAALLNDRIVKGYRDSLSDLSSAPGVELVVSAADDPDGSPAPSLLSTSLQSLLAHPKQLTAEVFGPTALVVSYQHEEELVQAAEVFEGQLTSTIIGNDDDQIAAELISVLSRKAGRILWNQWPTGVSVTYAQQHGGPYPATTSVTSTSVGTAAVSRFLRPIAYQGFPQHLLPVELREA
ncbi:aldehyde dehydrogenase [Psychromicrobium lacuslunae]|uniref:Aldehyde dehydrogenase n=1 Tax=Psychromicrobium lacuslunae TaxID=1618207 RepID=A0A0D4C447_9MICC|nr:aldehyde dehydrogenase [Psychromicrobium lacuslunae]